MRNQVLSQLEFFRSISRPPRVLLLAPVVLPSDRAQRWRLAGCLLACLLALSVTPLAVANDEGGAATAAKTSRPIEARKNLVFSTMAGESLKADMFRPADQEVYPMVVMIHGGGWSSGDKWNLHDHARELAQAGFVAVAINYRLAPIHRFPAQIDDCRAALVWAVEQADDWRADSQRVAVWGYSAGAHLAALLATKPAPDEPKLFAAILGGAPCEFSFVPEESTVLAAVMGGSRKQLPKVYCDASPLEFASPQVCPTFFFHGSHDLIVPQASSHKLFVKLQELDVTTEYHVVDRQGHLLTFIDGTSRRMAIEFLQKHLPAAH